MNILQGMFKTLHDGKVPRKAFDHAFNALRAALLCGLSALWLAVPAAGENLVENWDFSRKKADGGPAEWTAGHWREARGVCSLDAETFHSSPAAFRIEHDTTEPYTLLQQDLTLKPDTEYRLSLWMKGEDIRAEDKAVAEGRAAGTGILLLRPRPEGGTFRRGSPEGLWRYASGTFDWSRFEMVFNTGSLDNLRLYLVMVNASGVAWFDSLRVEEVKTDADDLAVELLPVDFHEHMPEYRRAVYHLAGEMPGILMLRLKGDSSRHDDVRLIMDLPEGVELVGASPARLRPEDGEYSWQTDEVESEPVQRGGHPYRRHIIKINDAIIRSMRPDSLVWANEQMIYLRADPEVKNGGGTVYWSLFSPAGRTAERSFDIIRLPEPSPPSRPLERFALMAPYLLSQESPFSEVRRAYRDYWKTLHRRPLSLGHTHAFPGGEPLFAEFSRETVQKNFDFLHMVGGSGAGSTPHLRVGMWLREERERDSSFAFPPHLLEDGTAAARPDGVRIGVCPAYLGGDPLSVFWERMGPEMLSRILAHIERPEGVTWNSEPGTEGCYCETCLEDFRVFAGLEEKPSLSCVLEELQEDWYRFRVGQNAEIVANFSRMLERHFPRKTFWLTGPRLRSDGSSPAWCTLDSRLSDPYVRGHMQMVYIAGKTFYDDFSLNVAAHQAPVFPLVNPTQNSLRWYNRYTPDKIVQNMVAAAALGGEGIGFYPYDHFDGAYLLAISRGASLISVGEPYYFGRRDDSLLEVSVPVLGEDVFEDEGQTIRITYPDSENLRFVVHENDGELLLSLFNYNETEELPVRVAVPEVPAAGFHVFQAGSSLQYVDEKGGAFSRERLREGFMCVVPKDGVLLLEFLRDDQKTATGQIRQDALDEKIERMRRQVEDTSDFPRKSEGDAAVSWGDVERNNVPDLKLTLGENSAYFSPYDNARLISWRRAEAPLSDLFVHGENRGWGSDLLLYDCIHANFPFALRSVDIRDGFPEAVFSYTVPEKDDADPVSDPHTGLFIEKTVRLENRGDTLRVLWRFENRNPAGQPIPLGFRIRHYPRLGGRMAGQRTLRQISTVFVPTPGELAEISAGAPTHNVWLADPGRGSSFTDGIAAEPGKWEPGSVVVRAEAEGIFEELVVEPDPRSTDSLYVWWSRNFTVELATADMVLKAGETFVYESRLRRK